MQINNDLIRINTNKELYKQFIENYLLSFKETMVVEPENISESQNNSEVMVSNPTELKEENNNKFILLDQKSIYTSLLMSTHNYIHS